MKLINKINVFFIIIGILIFSACGSTNESSDQGKWSEKKTCETVSTIRDDIRQNQLDVVNGKKNLSESLAEIGMIQVRIELVQQFAPDGDLKEAVTRWGLSRQRIIDAIGDNDQNQSNRLMIENEAAVEALDKVCK